MDTFDPVAMALNIAARPRKAEGGDAETPASPSYIKPMDWSQPKVSPLGLYSHAATVAGKMPMAKGSPDQVKGYLLKQGVKPDEIEHSKFDDKFGGQKSVTREQVAQHFHNNQPQLDESVKTEDVPFEQYTLPGGKNYRMAALTTPIKTSPKAKEAYALTARMQAGDFNSLNEEGRRALFQKRDDLLKAAKSEEGEHYRPPSGHQLPDNTILHRRLSDRPLPDGGKALHLEELQSDWGQEGRDKGFRLSSEVTAPMDSEYRQLVNKNAAAREAGRTPDAADVARARDLEAQLMRADASKTPHHPLVDKTGKWLDLGLKRTLYDAAKGGYGKVLITPGDEQASRYDLSKHINDLTLHGTGDNLRLSATDKQDRKVIDMQHVTPKTLAEHVGKDAAEKLLNMPEPSEKNPYAARRLHGLDLKVGGEGMKSFYDKMLPQALEKLAKRHDPDAKMGTTTIKGDPKVDGPLKVSSDGKRYWVHSDTHGKVSDYFDAAHKAMDARDDMKKGPSLHSIDITPKMRASILKGMPTFATGGTVDDDDASELENIKSIHPAKRTADQVRRLHGLKLPGDEGPQSPPMLLRAMGGRIRQADEDQIGDHTPAQAKASANGTTPRSDIIDKGLAILHTQADEITKDAERTGKATGGSVSDDRLDKLMALVAEQADAINRLTTILSTPQTVVRDKEGRIKEVRRIPNKKALN
jgi:hypothetical protein